MVLNLCANGKDENDGSWLVVTSVGLIIEQRNKLMKKKKRPGMGITFTQL